MKLFDAHCHLQLPQFDADREEALARMQESGVGGIVVGTDFKTSREAVELAEQYDFLWASVGLHPNDNVEEEFDASNYKELAADSKVVAIGECGLDYFRSGTTPEEREAQKKRFIKQIDLALELNKPLIIHCRDAHEDMLLMLKDYTGTHPKLKVIIHFFTGSGELAQTYLDLGCYLSFPGPITYTDMYNDSIKVTPLDKILSETDSPFAAPVPFRGKRNEPAYVAEVVKKIAAIKELPVEEMAAKILENSKKIFKV
ncbi:MAG TPA: TatD family hydrolase [Candidatus Paceibacterota bacterium]